MGLNVLTRRREGDNKSVVADPNGLELVDRIRAYSIDPSGRVIVPGDKIEETGVVLDYNSPHAGLALRFGLVERFRIARKFAELVESTLVPAQDSTIIEMIPEIPIEIAHTSIDLVNHKDYSNLETVGSPDHLEDTQETRKPKQKRAAHFIGGILASASVNRERFGSFVANRANSGLQSFKEQLASLKDRFGQDKENNEVRRPLRTRIIGNAAGIVLMAELIAEKIPSVPSIRGKFNNQENKPEPLSADHKERQGIKKRTLALGAVAIAGTFALVEAYASTKGFHIGSHTTEVQNAFTPPPTAVANSSGIDLMPTDAHRSFTGAHSISHATVVHHHALAAMHKVHYHAERLRASGDTIYNHVSQYVQHKYGSNNGKLVSKIVQQVIRKNHLSQTSGVFGQDVHKLPEGYLFDMPN